jgi:predicted dehydrogenase
MSEQPIRWGILATGAIAGRFVEDLQRMPDAEVVAVGSRTQAAADAFAQRYQIPRAYGDWASLAADPAVDVVYVATPQSAHHASAKLCLDAGRAVLCEKPLTLDLATSRELVRAADSAGVFFMEAMWTRCNPVIRRVGELLADGAIGEVTVVQADFGLGPLPPEHRLHSMALGGGALLDLGVYPITIAHLALGTPESIEAWASLTQHGVDENTGMLFGYPSGALAALTCGLTASTGLTATITGRGGRIELPAPFFRPERAILHRGAADPRAILRPAGGEPEVIEHPLVGHGFIPEAAEVHRCLRAGLTQSPLMPHATSLAVMSIMDDVRRRIGLTYEPVAIPAQRTTPA